MRIFVDMDGTLAKWNNVEFEQLYEKGYYRNLEPNKKILDEVNRLIEQGEDVYILSCYLKDSQYALEEKKEWCKAYLPQLNEEKYVFVPFGENKGKFFNERGLSPITNHDYLIDDYTRNLIEWKELGGIGVKYLNGINHTRGTWKGLMINEKTPEYNNTDLINFILSEKLKEEGITLFASYDLGSPGDMSYDCIYGNKYFDVQQLSYERENPEELTINEIKSKICTEAQKENLLNSSKETITSNLLNQYYSRHYPTISKCKDFETLYERVKCNELDDIEYTVFLYENDKEKCFSLNEAGELNINSNDPRIKGDYVLWYEGLITTSELIKGIDSKDYQEEKSNDMSEPDITGNL